MKEYEKHVLDELKTLDYGHNTSFCGENIEMIWTFLDVTHMVNTIVNQGRLLPCPLCKRAILKIIKES